MPRPRKDGTPARDANKHKLTELYVQKLQRKPPARTTLIWDTQQSGLLCRPSQAAIMDAVAAKIMSLVTGTGTDNVITFTRQI